MAILIPLLIWWFIIEILGLAALPLTYRLFKNLPDRGYAFAKPLGLLLTSYVLWIGASSGFLRNSWGGIVFSILVVAVASWWFYSRRNTEAGIASFLRRNKRMVIANEALFALAFVLFALFRACNPEIMGTEKPMEFAFLNAILRSDTFPPHDPWLSGFGISYYYFGYLMMAMLTKLSGVASAVAFNLGITLLFTLTVTGAYALVYNLIEGRGNEAMRQRCNEATRQRGNEVTRQRGQPINSSTRYLVPLLGPLFVAILGNLEGIFEVLYSKGLGSARFWSWLDIKELVSNGRITERWFDLGSGWWWWRASRVIHDKDLLGNSVEVIDEFPFFSFMLGDMHPHVLALPFVLLALALALNVLRQKAISVKNQTSNVNLQPPISNLQSLISNIQSPFSNLQHPLLHALCLGSLAFINTWDFPIYLFVVAMAYGLHRYGHCRFAYQDGEVNWALVKDIIYTAVGLGLLGGVLYLPFYFGFQSQAGGILPHLFNPTRLHQYLIFFGPFVFVIIGFAALVTKQLRAEVESRELVSSGLKTLFWTIILPPLAILGSIALVALTAGGQAFLRGILENERVRQQIGGADLPSLIRRLVTTRLGNPWTWLFLALLIAWVVVLLWWRLRISESANQQKPGSDTCPEPGRRDPTRAISDPLRIAESSTLFVLLIVATGLVLTLSVEFVYLRDTFGTRMNTVFKFYYQAWILLALASAYGVYYVAKRARGLGRGLFLVGVVALFALGMVYPLVAGFDKAVATSKAGGFAPQPTLDGLAWVRQHSPDEYAAVQWLNEHVLDNAVILEVTGGSFTEYGRVSSRTGLPTLLGWGGHELQWRGNYDEPGRREPDISAIYSSTDIQHILTLFEKYGITYVYVGSLERGKYNPAALAKFDRFMDVAFQQGSVTIYKRRP